MDTRINRLWVSIKDVWPLLLLVGFAILIAIGGIVNARANAEAHAQCMLHGYPELVEVNHIYFCHKLVDGTDIVIALESLE